jgi:pimeloyl-ACP methyl ester carboxylesterase
MSDLPRRLPATLPQLLSEEFLVPATDAGINLYVRNKRPAALPTFSPQRTLLYVHGSTYPASTAFDLKIDGCSWMDFIAARGFDVWLLDLRGYGHSTRPREMSEPPENNPPLVRTDTAVADIGAVVDHIFRWRQIDKLNLLGWSWGTTQMATYTTRNPHKVNRLVLYAPQWIRPLPAKLPPKPGAYRTVTRAQMLERWLHGVPADKRDTLIPAGWFDTWADATMATDKEGAQRNPPVLRAPGGTVADTQEIWTAAQKPFYDPREITVPVLIAVAEWDRDNPPALAQTLFPLLVNAPYKRLVMLAEGTHTIMLEKNRIDLFNAVQQFLEE